MSGARDPNLPVPAQAAGTGLEQLLARPLADRDVDAATAELAAPLEHRSGSVASLLAFRAGGEILALQAEETAKVVPCSAIHRVPHRGHAVFRGIANHDGELLLCMSIEAALGLAAPADAAPRAMVVAEAGRERWAFPVDSVIGVTDVEAASLRQPPLTVSAARTGCARALFRIAEGEGVLLDVAMLASIFRGATA
jgi:chemotaxis signal transduction protein